MAKKGTGRAPRKSAAEVVKSFSREDVIGSMKEYRDLRTKALEVQSILSTLKLAQVDTETMNKVRDMISAESQLRRTYLADKLRRVALAIVRAEGMDNMLSIIDRNIDSIPLASDKQASAQFAHNVTNAESKEGEK